VHLFLIYKDNAIVTKLKSYKNLNLSINMAFLTSGKGEPEVRKIIL
jgi:hypothetical protein